MTGAHGIPQDSNTASLQRLRFHQLTPFQMNQRQLTERPCHRWMAGVQLFLPDTDGTYKQGLCLVNSAHPEIKVRQVGECPGHSGGIYTSRRLKHADGLAETAFCVLFPALRRIHRPHVPEGDRHIGMTDAQGTAFGLESLQVITICQGVVAGIVIQGRKVTQAACNKDVILRECLPSNFQYPLVIRQCFFIPVLVVVIQRQFIKYLGDQHILRLIFALQDYLRSPGGRFRF